MLTDSQRIAQLEQDVKRLMQQNASLVSRINFLEREGNRRRSEVNQIASAINRRG